MARKVRLWLVGAIAVMVIRPARAGEVVLHTFSRPPKGGYPSGVIRDSKGDLDAAAAEGGGRLQLPNRYVQH